MCSKTCCFEHVDKTTFRCCGHGTLHVCDGTCRETFVSEHGTVTCQWTGKCFEQRQQNHPFAAVETNVAYDRTHRPTLKRKRERNPFRNLKVDTLTRDSMELLRMLLYSTLRESHNEHQRELAKKKIQKHIRRRIRSGPTEKKDIQEIIDAHQPTLLPVQPYNESKCREYSLQCLRYWQYLATTAHGKAQSSHIRYRDMVVAILVLMRSGVHFDQHLIIPADAFLQTMMPSQRHF